MQLKETPGRLAQSTKRHQGAGVRFTTRKHQGAPRRLYLPINDLHGDLYSEHLTTLYRTQWQAVALRDQDCIYDKIQTWMLMQ